MSGLNGLEDDRLIWADVETTGLEDYHCLLEIAVVVTDADLTVLGDPVSVVLRPAEGHLALMDDYVRDMHTCNGLLDACRESTAGFRDAEEEIMAYVHQWVGRGKSPLCGSTPAFDRHFINRDVPAFGSYLHYRYIDVSTVKGLAQRWFPRTYATLANATTPQRAHRALPDVYDSLTELRFYRANIFDSSVQFVGP